MTEAASACFMCGEPIASVLQRVDCRRCARAAHRGCLNDNRCPDCGELLDLGATGPSDDAIRDETGGLDAIGGWLLVLIVVLCASVAFNLVAGIILLLGGSSASWRLWAAATIGVNVYGGWCARMLSAKRRSAPRHTAIFFALTIVMSLLAVAVATQAGDATDNLGRPMLPAIAWLIYLARSRRVKAVYGEMNVPRDAR